MTTATNSPSDTATARVHISIGSNAGPSREIVEAAIEAVEALSEGPGRHSSLIVTQPWGFESPHMFVNAGVDIDTALDPAALLDRLQRIEQELPRRFGIAENRHRNADGTYRDRPLDLDIIFYGALCLATDSITVPHPCWRQREFVTAPLLQLHPGHTAETVWPGCYAGGL